MALALHSDLRFASRELLVVVEGSSKASIDEVAAEIGLMGDAQEGDCLFEASLDQQGEVREEEPVECFVVEREQLLDSEPLVELASERLERLGPEQRREPGLVERLAATSSVIPLSVVVARGDSSAKPPRTVEGAFDVLERVRRRFVEYLEER